MLRLRRAFAHRAPLQTMVGKAAFAPHRALMVGAARLLPTLRLTCPLTPTLSPPGRASAPSARRAQCMSQSASLHVLDALDEAGELGAVLVPHRPDSGLEWRLVGNVGDLDAGLLHLFQGGLLHVVPQGALLLLRLARELADEI